MPSVLDLPPADRPRERLRALGAQSLTTSELLGLLLGSAPSGTNTTEVATALLARALMGQPL